MDPALIRPLVAVALGLASAAAWPAAEVAINGSLTSFQSALSPNFIGGNGTLNGAALTLDPAAPTVTYPGSRIAFPQSTTVGLPAGTPSVRFEYTDQISTGTGQHNLVGFEAAAPVTVDVGDVFKVGTITYTNGFWYPFARVGIRIDVSSAEAALDGHSFEGSIIVAVSSPEPFVPEPESNADYFYLEDVNGPLSALGSVRVYEPHIQPAGNPGNTGTVDLYARIGSLIPERFDNPNSGAFLSTSLDPLPAVPEPSTQAMLLAGLVLAGWLARFRKV